MRKILKFSAPREFLLKPSQRFVASATFLGLLLFANALSCRAQTASPQRNADALEDNITSSSTAAPAMAGTDLPPAANTEMVAPVPSAAASSTAGSDSGWHLMVAPYLWIPWVYGTIGANGNDARFYATPGELFSHFRFGLLGVVQPSYKRLLLPLDIIWLRLGDDKAQPRTPNGTVVNVKADVFVLTPKIGYRVIDAEKIKIDALVGFRYWHLGQNVSFTTNSLSFSGSQNWVDPLVGGRITGILSPKVEATIGGDVGGWGVGSQLDYQVFGILGYRIKPALALQAGYRYLDLRYANGTRVFAPAMSGPFFGVTINLK
jgi:hypothetical protein